MSDDLIADAAQVAQEYQAAIAQETLNLRHAEQANDFAARRESMRALAALRATAKEFDLMCREHHQAVTSAPPPNKHGLSPEKQEAAEIAMPHLPKDEREEIYAKGEKDCYRNQRFSWQNGMGR